MAHIQIEYSGNLDDRVEMGAFCEALRAEAAKIEALPMPGLRVRATRVDHYAIADGNPDHGFVDISLRLRGGRSAAVKDEITRRVFEAARAYLAPVMAQHSIALSFELRDIDPAYSPKTGTIRDHLEA